MIFAVLFIALPLSAVEAASEIPDGKTIYENSCAGCHGIDGGGNKFGQSLKPFPARNHRAIAATVSRDEMRRIITYGVHDTDMHAQKLKLDPLQIEAVIDHIKTFDYTPDLNSGEIRFRQVCASCHGMDGRARTGLGAKNLVYSRLNLQEMVHTIRHGRPGTLMTAAQHQLNNRDIADIANYIYSLRYRADTGNGAKLYSNHCQACHTTPGDIKLIGNAAKKTTIKSLSNRLLDLRIRHGRHVNRAGKHIRKLSDDHVQDIIAYIRQAAR